MKRIIIAAALAGTTITGIAAAQTAGQTTAPTAAGKFRGDRGMGLDLNKDGVITRADVIAATDARFAKLDANKDGKITADERSGRRTNMPDITQEQMRQAALARFDRADANKDGKIDATERQAMRGMHRGGRGGPDGMRHGGRGHGGAMAAMAMADTNRDGVVTKAEAVAATQAMFDRLDTNRDGKIDQAERDAARDAMKARRGGGAAQPGGAR